MTTDSPASERAGSPDPSCKTVSRPLEVLVGPVRRDCGASRASQKRTNVAGTRECGYVLQEGAALRESVLYGGSMTVTLTSVAGESLAPVHGVERVGQEDRQV